MCNRFQHYRAWDEYVQLMQEAETPIEGPPVDLPNSEIAPSELAPIVMAAGGGARLELAAWGWPPYSGKGLVINVRSENRKDPRAARGLTIPTGFYEFGEGKAPKPKYLFTPAGNEPMAFPVIVRSGRFSLITTEPGVDVGAVHDRQPVLIPLSDWRRWLTDPEWPADLMEGSPAGTLHREQVR